MTAAAMVREEEREEGRKEEEEEEKMRSGIRRGRSTRLAVCRWQRAQVRRWHESSRAGKVEWVDTVERSERAELRDGGDRWRHCHVSPQSPLSLSFAERVASNPHDDES